MIDERLWNRFWKMVNEGGDDDCWEWTGQQQGGYGRFKVDGINRLAHRVSYTLLIGPIPEGMVTDHVCHNRSCVNPKHIRICSVNQNAKNRKLNKNNKCGLKGVAALNGRWRAQIRVNKKLHHLGMFDTKEEAFAAYCKAADELHGEFANHGVS